LTLVEVRDIAIVVLGAVSIITTLVLVVTAMLVWRLLSVVRDEVRPILRSGAETAATIKGLAAAASESSAGSVAAKSVAAAGGARKLASLFRGRPK